MKITNYDTYRQDNYNDPIFGITTNDQPTAFMQHLHLKEWHYWFYDIESTDDIFMFTLIDVRNCHYICFYADNEQHPFPITSDKQLQQRIIQRMETVNDHMKQNKYQYEFYRLNNIKQDQTQLRLLRAILPVNSDNKNLIKYENKQLIGATELTDYTTIPISIVLLKALNRDDPIATRLFDKQFYQYQIAKYIGFNSNVYDLSMLTTLMDDINYEADDNIITAHKMFEFNEDLFKAEKQENKSMLSYFYDDEVGNRATLRRKRNIRQAWLNTGRFIDVFQNRIGLKNMAAAMGRTIKENDHLGKQNDHISNTDDLAELFAYNACDIFNTAQTYQLPATQTTINTKQSLLDMFPELTFTKDAITNTMKYDPEQPNVLPLMMIDGITHQQYRTHFNQMRERLYTVNDTPPTLAQNIVAPYAKLVDDSHVRFIFPRCDRGMTPEQKQLYHQQLKKVTNGTLTDYMQKHEISYYKRGDYVNQRNKTKIPNNKDDDFQSFNILNRILDYADTNDHKYFPETIKDDNHGIIYHQIAPICDYYYEISQYNFNNSDVNKNQYILDADNHPDALIKITKKYEEQGKLIIPYILRNPQTGQPIESDCYCKFSYGGLHGAQYNKTKFQQDHICYEHRNEYQEYRQQHPKLKASQVTDDMYLSNKPLSLFDDYQNNTKIPLKYFVKTTSNGQKRWITKTQLNNMATWYGTKGTTLGKVKTPYVFTSDNNYYQNLTCAHNDLTSYYPTNSERMAIYYHPKDNTTTPLAGYDIYDEIYIMRVNYKAQSKDKTLPAEERNHAKAIANALKLVINSLTGKSDSNQESNVRLNNKIIAMRCIGQLLTWCIGQELALHGYINISTNTDGIYSFVPNEPNIQQKVQKTIDDITRSMYLGIKAEMIDTFISKDSNNRLELQKGTAIKGIKPTKHTPVLNQLTIDDNSGSMLAALTGNNVVKTTSHPSIVDTILGLYLTIKPNAVNRPYDIDLINQLLQQQIDGLTNPTLLMPKKHEIINRFAWTLRGNNNKKRYLYLNNTRLQRINRILLIKQQNNSQHITLHAEIYDKETNKYNKTNIVKYPGLDPEQNVKLINDNINKTFNTNQACNAIAQQIDTEAYERMIYKAFTNWSNV